MQFEKISAPSLKDLFVRQLRDAIVQAILNKPSGHHFGAETEEEDEGSNMNEIGG